jgi:predicted membrane protein
VYTHQQSLKTGKAWLTIQTATGTHQVAATAVLLVTLRHRSLLRSLSFPYAVNRVYTVCIDIIRAKIVRESFVIVLFIFSIVACGCMIHGHTGARKMASFVLGCGFSPQKLLCKFVDTLYLSDLLYINMYDSVSYVVNRSMLRSELT